MFTVEHIVNIVAVNTVINNSMDITCWNIQCHNSYLQYILSYSWHHQSICGTVNTKGNSINKWVTLVTYELHIVEVAHVFWLTAISGIHQSKRKPMSVDWGVPLHIARGTVVSVATWRNRFILYGTTAVKEESCRLGCLFWTCFWHMRLWHIKVHRFCLTEGFNEQCSQEFSTHAKSCFPMGTITWHAYMWYFRPHIHSLFISTLRAYILSSKPIPLAMLRLFQKHKSVLCHVTRFTVLMAFRY